MLVIQVARPGSEGLAGETGCMTGDATEAFDVDGVDGAVITSLLVPDDCEEGAGMGCAESAGAVGIFADVEVEDADGMGMLLLPFAVCKPIVKFVVGPMFAFVLWF